MSWRLCLFGLTSSFGSMCFTNYINKSVIFLTWRNDSLEIQASRLDFLRLCIWTAESNVFSLQIICVYTAFESLTYLYLLHCLTVG